MEIQGKIKVIYGDEQVSASFRNRELVVTTDEQYPQHILIQFVQDKCDLLDQYREGDEVKVSLNLRGREWVSPRGETRYFNTIQGWRIERVGQQAPSYQPQQQAQQPPPQDFGGDASYFDQQSMTPPTPEMGYAIQGQGYNPAAGGIPPAQVNPGATMEGQTGMDRNGVPIL